MRQTNLKPIYNPNLDEFISQCEINYCLIVKLFPSLAKTKYEKLKEVNDKLEFNDSDFKKGAVDELEQTRDYNGIICLEFIEQSSYTTTIKLNFKAPSKIVKKELNLLVRLYHDAKLLEVMDGLTASKLRAIRAVENINVHGNKSIDDKRQMNQFLGESLKVCLSQVIS